jgi:hypothetical protein
MEVTWKRTTGTVSQECFMKLLDQKNIECYVSKFKNCIRTKDKTILLVGSTSDLLNCKNKYDLVVFYTLRDIKDTESTVFKIHIWSYNDPDSSISSFSFKDPEKLIPYLTK